MPFGVLVEAGLLRPGDDALRSQRPPASRACAPTAACRPPTRWASSRLDPQGRRHGAGRAGLQRLDLLALQVGRRAPPIDQLRQQVRAGL